VAAPCLTGLVTLEARRHHHRRCVPHGHAAELLQSLEAILLAELADNECWETLTGLARLAGQEELAEQCEEALVTEQEHLEKVRSWLAAGQGRSEVEG